MADVSEYDMGAVQARVFQALVGARFQDGGHVLSSEDAAVLTNRVLAVLNLTELCAVCGLVLDDCTGDDHSDHAHEYEPPIFARPSRAEREEQHHGS